MSTDAKARSAAAAFAVLLILSVFWPSPIVSVNRLSLNRDIGVDELSFLGREAPAWDVVFWCIAGLFAIGIVQTSEVPMREALREVRAVRFAIPRHLWAVVAGAAVATAAAWIFLDSAAVAWAERIQSDTTESFVRIMNRLAGGMNPALIVFFFLLAGAAYRRKRWIGYAAAMALAGLSAGLFAQAVKFIVGRTRPELWLGPFHYARNGANSFPSGHTVGAFALAGVLLFASPSRWVRAIALVLAVAAGLSRILAFRHWSSDVVASALIGLIAAWIFSSGARVLVRSV